MVTVSTHASHCANQLIYITVTDNYAQNLMPMIILTKIFQVPEFSRIQKNAQFSRVVSTLTVVF